MRMRTHPSRQQVCLSSHHIDGRTDGRRMHVTHTDRKLMSYTAQDPHGTDATRCSLRLITFLPDGERLSERVSRCRQLTEHGACERVGTDTDTDTGTAGFAAV